MNDNRQSKSILVVDDEVDTCQNLADILIDLGYRVDMAHDGPAALELVKSNHYDVALLDLKLPGMDGITLYREIRKLGDPTVAIIVTAYASSEATNDALSAGAWKIVAKPVNLPSLLSLVGEAVEQPIVLIVDDDQDLCGNLWDLLRERGYRVFMAHDAKQAALRLSGTDFHFALIDMKLPLGDGTEVFRMVRQSNPRARTILITGHRSEMEEMVAKVLNEGADAVCYKPFDVPGLLRTLDDLSDKNPREAMSRSPDS
jgi:DNA-binding response OmpR family regulator